MILYLPFVIFPTIYALVMSFFHGSLVQAGIGEFAGFANYAEALQSDAFWESLWHTVLFTLLTTPPLVILGFIFALLADRARRGRWFFRFAFFAPYVLPSAVMSLIGSGSTPRRSASRTAGWTDWASPRSGGSAILTMPWSRSP
jgi:multiple sugar transport system permease protein